MEGPPGEWMACTVESMGSADISSSSTSIVEMSE